MWRLRWKSRVFDDFQKNANDLAVVESRHGTMNDLFFSGPLIASSRSRIGYETQVNCKNEVFYKFISQLLGEKSAQYQVAPGRHKILGDKESEAFLQNL